MKLYIKRAVKGLSTFAALFVLSVIVYLGAAFITARMAGDVSVEAQNVANRGEPKSKVVYLISGLLHVDIAIPATPALLEQFSFLQSTDLPLDNSNLKYLTFGWGSTAFYTTAGKYSDIKINAVVRAVLGDSAVMRVVGMGVLQSSDDIVAVNMNAEQMERLVTFIEQSFAKAEGLPQQLVGMHLQTGDAFFVANGKFNAFNPCNQWVNESLRYAGVALGRWTPTTQALLYSLNYFSERPTVQP